MDYGPFTPKHNAHDSWIRSPGKDDGILSLPKHLCVASIPSAQEMTNMYTANQGRYGALGSVHPTQSCPLDLSSFCTSTLPSHPWDAQIYTGYCQGSDWKVTKAGLKNLKAAGLNLPLKRIMCDASGGACTHCCHLLHINVTSSPELSELWEPPEKSGFNGWTRDPKRYQIINLVDQQVILSDWMANNGPPIGRAGQRYSLNSPPSIGTT